MGLRGEMALLKDALTKMTLPKKNEKDTGKGSANGINGKGNNTTGTGVTIEAGAPKNININITNFQPGMKIESVSGDIPTSEMKEITGRAMLELLNDASLMEGQQHG
jgi:hypothetical protein